MFLSHYTQKFLYGQLSSFISNNTKSNKYVHRGHQNFEVLKLAKFITNSKNILKELLPYRVSQKHSIVDLDLQNTATQRTLGALWDTENSLL